MDCLPDSLRGINEEQLERELTSALLRHLTIRTGFSGLMVFRDIEKHLEWEEYRNIKNVLTGEVLDKRIVKFFYKGQEFSRLSVHEEDILEYYDSRTEKLRVSLLLFVAIMLILSFL
jgi:hypothetical protein